MPEAGIAPCDSWRDLKCDGRRTAAHGTRDEDYSVVTPRLRAKAPRPRHAGTADESGSNILVSQRSRPRRVYAIAPKRTRPVTWRPNWARRGTMRCTQVRMAYWLRHGIPLKQTMSIVFHAHDVAFLYLSAAICSESLSAQRG